MGEQEEQEQGGTGGLTAPAVTALAGLAAAGVSYYAVRKAFSHDGADHSSGEAREESPTSSPDEPKDVTDHEDEEETDDAGAVDDTQDEDSPESTAEDDGDEAYDGDSEPQVSRRNRAGRSPAVASTLQSVRSGALGTASRALAPLAEERAEAAGRYVAEHAPEAVREKLVPRFIEAFEKAR